MATRPVFFSAAEGQGLVNTVAVDFKWHAGMARSQKQRSVQSLHAAALARFPGTRILEISSASDNPLGVNLSAFHLTITTRQREITLECAFQGSKVFENGGPYTDLLTVPPIEAKRDPRLQNSGRLTGFRFFGQDWALEPFTAFYDWIYINALDLRPDLAEPACGFDAFTDIAFNPQKSVNCQAGAAALYVSLRRRGLLKTALASREAYLALISQERNRVFGTDDKGQGLLF